MSLKPFLRGIFGLAAPRGAAAHRSPLRLFAVKLGWASQPTFNDLPFGNKFVLEPIHLSRGLAIMKAIDY
jgi:hypothetical protein